MKRRDATINLRVPGDLRSALERAAEEESRTLSGLIVKIFEDWVRDEGRRRAVGRPGVGEVSGSLRAPVRGF